MTIVTAAPTKTMSRLLPYAASAPAPRDPAATLADVEREHIQRVLAETGGNKTLAAKRLGVSLRSLYRRLEKLGLKDPAEGK